MRVIGFDPGTALFGYGVIDTLRKQGRTCYHTLEYGCIRTPAKQPLPERLATIYQECGGLFDKYTPDAVAIERVYFSKNVTTAISVSHARGVALALAAVRGLSISEFDPSEIKLAITGYGKADKNQMQKMVQLLLNLDSIPRPDDAADALAVALCRLVIKFA